MFGSWECKRVILFVTCQIHFVIVKPFHDGGYRGFRVSIGNSSVSLTATFNQYATWFNQRQNIIQRPAALKP